MSGEWGVCWWGDGGGAGWGGVGRGWGGAGWGGDGGGLQICSAWPFFFQLPVRTPLARHTHTPARPRALVPPLPPSTAHPLTRSPAFFHPTPLSLPLPASFSGEREGDSEGGGGSSCFVARPFFLSAPFPARSSIAPGVLEIRNSTSCAVSVVFQHAAHPPPLALS